MPDISSCSGSLHLRGCMNFAFRLLHRTQPETIRLPGSRSPFPYIHVRELLISDKILTPSKTQEIHT